MYKNKVSAFFPFFGDIYYLITISEGQFRVLRYVFRGKAGIKIGTKITFNAIFSFFFVRPLI